MKPFGKIFAGIFAAMGLLALVGGMCGATHQFVLAGICTFLALMMWPEKQDQVSHKFTNF
jgi:hypothetical protein